jgi:hypothetical protein
MAEIFRRKQAGEAWETAVVETGDSLPAWWTVDSTPDAESFEIGGVVRIAPAATNTTHPALLLVGQQGADPTEQLFQVVDDDFFANVVFEINGAGQVGITEQDDGGSGPATFVIAGSGAIAGTKFLVTGAGNMFEVSSAAAGPFVAIRSGAFLRIDKISAPADAALAAGQCAFWFDRTNGAAALNIKAKQQDGTVKTATIALT